MVDNKHKDPVGYYDRVALENGGIYEAQGSISLWAQAKMKNAVCNLIANDRHTLSVADMGCGNGDVLLMLARRRNDLTLVGIDQSPEMVRLANAAVEPSFKERMRFIVGNFSLIPLENKSVDTLLSIGATCYIEPASLERALAEMARVARKRLIIEFKNAASPYFFIKKARAKNTNGLEMFGQTLGQFQKALAPYGFRVESTHNPIPLGTIFSPNIVASFITTPPPHTNGGGTAT